MNQARLRLRRNKAYDTAPAKLDATYADSIIESVCAALYFC